jgi:hypothetical protein
MIATAPSSAPYLLPVLGFVDSARSASQRSGLPSGRRPRVMASARRRATASVRPRASRGRRPPRRHQEARTK